MSDLQSELTIIRKMLTALLGDQIQVAGGYVYGRTANDDPFIVLYPARENLIHKICRVYPHDFKKLPAFIPTEGDIPGDTDGNPDKDKAQKKGIYHPCQPFVIVTREGKETQMGREVRFGDMLYVIPPKKAQETPSSTGAPKAPPPPQTSAQAPATSPGAVPVKPPDTISADEATRLHALGSQKLGIQRWAEKVTGAAQWVSEGAVDNIEDLTPGEAAKLETWLSGLGEKRS